MRLIDADEFKKQEILEKLRTVGFDDEIMGVAEKEMVFSYRYIPQEKP